jgi:hypothetical protein
MLNDRRYQILTELEDQSQAGRTEDSSLWGLLRSLHSAAELREFVSFESIALRPWVRRGEGGDQVHVLLAVAAADGRLAPPWAHLAWSWPERRLLLREDVRARLAGAPDLAGECRCTRQIADRVEDALRRGTEPPPLPAAIAALVARLAEDGGEAAGGRPGETAALAADATGGMEAADSAHAADPAGRSGIPERSAGLMSQLEAAHGLLRDLGSPELDQEWRRIYAHLVASRFAVAVLGEPERGKSTLINRLLGEDVLPIRPRDPRIDTLEVRASTAAALWLLTASGESQLPPGAALDEALATLLADGPPAGVRSERPNAWLATSDLRLIEVALQDGVARPSDRVLDVLAEADAVLFVMSATMAMSLSEQRLVEQYVLARQVPRIAVVLTRLDSVSTTERGEVVALVRRKVLGWGPEVEVYAVDRGAGTADPQGIDELRSQLAAWSNDPDHRRLVQGQATANLRQLLGRMHDEFQARENAAARAEEARQLRLTAARQEFASRQLDWRELRLEVDRLHHATLVWLEQKMQEQRSRLLDDLLYRLSNSPNPKLWWERDLTFQLQAFESAAPAIEQALQQRIAADGNALVRAVEERFTRPLPLGPTAPVIGFDKQPPGRAAGQIDIRYLGYAVRAGSVAAMGLALFRFSLNPILSASSLLLGEIILHQTVDKQRKTLSEELPGLIDDLIDGALTGARQHLREIYAGFGKALADQEAAWSRTKEAAIAQTDPGAPPLPHRLAEVEKIQKALAG